LKTAECDAEGHLVDGIMCRVASGTGQHSGWMREVADTVLAFVKRFV
jgi:hypothetical protein